MSFLQADLFVFEGSILIFMDQQITAVIVNRKEHKLNVRDHVNGKSAELWTFQ